MGIQFNNNKRTLLAVIIAALFASPLHAEDWVVDEGWVMNGGSETKDIASTTVWTGNVIIHPPFSGQLNIGETGIWNGSFTGIAPSNNWPSGFRIDLSTGSAWNGSLLGVLQGYVDMHQTDFTGHIDMSGVLYLAGYDHSVLNGDISFSNFVDNGRLTYTLEDSQWTGNAYITDSESIISFTRSRWDGDSIKNMTDPAMSANGRHLVQLVNTQWNGDNILSIGAGAGPSSNNMLYVWENSVWHGNMQMTAVNSDWQPMKYDVSVDNSKWYGDSISTGNISSIHVVNQQGEWHGNLIINGIEDKPDWLDAPHSIEMSAGALWVGHTVSDEAYTSLRLSDQSQWTMTGDSKLTTLSFYGWGETPSVVFSSPDNMTANSRDYRTLTVGNLIGDQMHMTFRAGYYGAKDYGSDKLILNNDSASASQIDNPVQLTVINNGSDNTHGTEAITIVETVHGLDQFNLTNDVELGGYMYSLEQQGTNWVLVSKTKGPGWQPPKQSSSASAIVNSAAANYLMSYAETDTLYQRMGDLRHNKADGDLWVRSYFGGLDGSETAQLSQFSMNYHGIQLGIDKMWQQSEAQVYAGVMAGMSNSDMDYDYSATQQGEGAIKSHHVGLYAGYTTDNGFYVDSQLKYNFNKNSFSVDDSATNTVSGQDRSRSVLGSVEVGKRFYLMAAQNGLYIEPQLQLTVAYHNSRNVTASNGLAVKMDSFTSTQGRAGAFIGYQVNDSETPVNFYIKGNYIKEFDGNIDYSLNGATERLSFDDQRWSHGIGVSVETSQQHNFYLDMEQSVGDRFKQHQLNAGYRYQF